MRAAEILDTRFGESPNSCHLATTEQTPDNEFSQSNSGAFVRRYWIRGRGFSLRFSRVQELRQLSTEQQLLAAILRNDALTARTLIPTDSRSPDFWFRFINLVERESLSNLVLENIMNIGIAGDLLGFSLGQQSLLQRLSKVSREQSGIVLATKRRFSALLKVLRKYEKQIVWTKGVYLTTLYSVPGTRTFSDYDLVIHPKVAAAVVSHLTDNGFTVALSPAVCNQLGAGPANKPADFFLAPTEQWTPTSALTLQKDGYPFLDIKISPFDRGIQMLELSRFFAESVEIECLGQIYQAPNLTDNLIIMLQNFAKENFVSWKCLKDIEVLTTKLNSEPELWNELLRCCRRESVCTSALIGLLIAVDRLNAAVPNWVLHELKKSVPFHSYLTAFTNNMSFVWNSVSLPMLVANALVSEDKQRKLTLLKNSIFPNPDFLQHYFATESKVIQNNRFCLLMYWLLLLCPAGIVRRSFGKIIWSSTNQSGNYGG